MTNKGKSPSSEPFRSYKVPREHLASLIEPPISDVPHVLRQNVQRIATWDCMIGDRSITDLRREGRAALIDEALSYTASYRDTVYRERSEDFKDRPVLLAGHQPELFHPGVWFKNFAISALGQSLSAWAINLIIDNDICSERSLRVPTLRDGEPAIDVVPLDRPSPVVPYEMANITDRQTFDCFATRVADSIAPLSNNPCVGQLWPAARAAADRTGNRLGLSIAQARHQLEAGVGLETLEVPLSQLCDSKPFCVFAMHLFDNLPRFQECYNESLIEYRAAHRIRSRSHPVPELDKTDGWLESPFWIYDVGDPNRCRLYVRRDGSQIQFSDLKKTRWSISRGNSAGCDLQTQAARQGVRIRPRALVTTMYARLVLSDYFLHGIGGGKYDQLNDTIMGRFWEITPPQFGVLSATYAPLSTRGRESVVDPDELRRLIRATYFQPERFASQATVPEKLVLEKQALLRNVPARGAKRDWHRRITEVNQQLAGQLDDTRQRLTDRLEQAIRSRVNHRRIASREFSFCVYPLDPMVQRLREMTMSPSFPNSALLDYS